MDSRLMPCPSITTLTLVSGWTDTISDALEVAIDQLLEANPILTGVLLSPRKGELSVQTARYDRSQLLRFIDVPSIYQQKEISIPVDMEGRLHWLQSEEVEGRYVPDLGNGYLQKSAQSILYEVVVIRGLVVDRPDLVVYAISISHVIADGATYYTLIEHLGRYITDVLMLHQGNGNEVTDSISLEIRNQEKYVSPLPNLDWTQRTSYDPEPKQLTRRDIFVLNFLPLPVAWIRILLLKFFGGQQSKFLFVNLESVKKIKAKINQKRKGTNDKSQSSFRVEDISTNDILTAAIASVAKEYSIMLAADMRQPSVLESDRASPHFAGNATRFINFPRHLAASEPTFVRSVVSTRFYNYDSAKVPLWPNLRADNCFVSNWAGLTRTLVTPGLETLVHAPCSKMLKCVPNKAVVFFVCDGKSTIAINHNLDHVPLTRCANDNSIPDVVFHEQGYKASINS